MNRTMKYFLMYLVKAVAFVTGVALYTFSVGYLLTQYFELDENSSTFIMFGVPMFLFGIYMLWDMAKQKVKMENDSLLDKLK